MGYIDSSGMYIPTSLEQTIPQAGGEYKDYGDLREIEVRITDLSALPSAAAVIPGGDNIFIPEGMTIEEVTVVADVAATGTGATLNFGTVRTDRSTEIDFNGLLTAAPLANMSSTGQRTVYTKGVSGAGALVGTVTGSNVGLLVAWYGTAFTAGAVTIRIKYRKIV